MNITNKTDGFSPISIFDISIQTLSFLAILFNSVALFIAIRYVSFDTRVEQLFVFNMTLCDFIFSILSLVLKHYLLNISLWISRPFILLAWVSTTGSVIFLLLLNIHKLITLFSPLRSLIIISKKQVTIQVIICWIFLFVVNLPYSTNAYYMKEFGASVSNPVHYACMVLFLYIVPLIISFILSTTIFVLAQKKARNVRAKEGKYVFRRIFFVFTSTVWTTLTCLPLRIAVFIAQICNVFQLTCFPSNNEFEINNHNEVIKWKNSTFDCSNKNNITTVPLFPSAFNQICIIKFGSIINYLLIILIFGNVVNPIITVTTQRMHRSGMIRLWRSLSHSK